MDSNLDDFAYIGAFIRSYRQANDESLQILADRSGVSRSMIAQIESGQKMPTIVVLAKLANAMQIRLSDLVEPPTLSPVLSVAEVSAENKVSRSRSAFICHKLVTKAGKFPADFYRFYFCRYGKTHFSSNVTGSVKYVWLESGELSLHFGGNTVSLSSGKLLTFDASTPHRFENRAGGLAIGVFMVAESND